jgi:ABC-type iron transport system FetAB permease component
MRRGTIALTAASAAAGTLLWGTLTPASAAMAAIETVQALEDESDEAVNAAIERAVQAAVRGALAMGLPQVELRGARLLPGAVSVQILARDAESQASDEEEPAGAVAPGRPSKPTL